MAKKKSNIDQAFAGFLNSWKKALRALKRAETSVATRFQALVELVKKEGFEPLFTTPANELEAADKRKLKALADAAAQVYGWRSETAGQNFRKLKSRIARELVDPGAVARESKARRQAGKAAAGQTNGTVAGETAAGQAKAAPSPRPERAGEAPAPRPGGNQATGQVKAPAARPVSARRLNAAVAELQWLLDFLTARKPPLQAGDVSVIRQRVGAALQALQAGGE